MIWGLDDRLRRVVKRDLRQLADGQLVLVEEIVWEYSNKDEGEFSPVAPTRISQTRTDNPGGGMMVITERARTSMDVSTDHLIFNTPAFGDWGALVLVRNGVLNAAAGPDIIDSNLHAMLAALPGNGGFWRPKPLLPDHLSTARLVDGYPPPPGIAVTPFVAPVWRPPQPLQPDPQVLAPAQSPRPMSLRGQRLMLESHTAGLLQLPTGRVVACDPDDYFLAERAPYTVAVPPGNHRVFLNVARPLDVVRPSPRVAAGGLLIRNEQVASWELALLPGEDPRLLRDGDTYGFGVDSGQACFMDSAAVQATAAVIANGEYPLVERVVGGVRIAYLGDPRSGANLIAFDSGWGDGRYPVWIGRTKSRDVACLVADMLLFSA